VFRRQGFLPKPSAVSITKILSALFLRFCISRVIKKDWYFHIRAKNTIGVTKPAPNPDPGAKLVPESSDS